MSNISILKIFESAPAPLINQQVNPFDYYFMTIWKAQYEKNSRTTFEGAAKMAQQALVEREKIFPMQVQLEGRLSDG